MPAVASFVVAVLLGVPAPSVRNSPEALVRAFYTTYLRIHAPGGLPDKDQLSQLSPFLSSSLQRLIVAALRYDTEFARRHPDDKPPFVDGEFFSSNFEGATGFDVGAIEKQGTGYRVLMEFSYADPGRTEDPFHWKDAIVVVEEHGRLVIDDVEFLGDWPFSNHGRLTATLRSRN